VCGHGESPELRAGYGQRPHVPKTTKKGKKDPKKVKKDPEKVSKRSKKAQKGQKVVYTVLNATPAKTP